MSKPKPPKLPDLTDEDLNEIFGPPQITTFKDHSWYDLNKYSREALDEMPYIERQWCCAAVGCQRSTAVRDYGHPRYFYWRRRWCSMYGYYYLCGRHKDLRYHEHDGSLKPRAEHSILLGNKLVNFSTNI